MSTINSPSQARTSEDEFGSYRSLSSWAVLSFVLGLLSLLSFAPSPVFIWIIPPAAILTGLLALRRIFQAPEVWSGQKLAQVGIALAVVCAGTATSVRYANRVRMGQEGKAIADRFLEKLKAGDVESAYWLMVPRELRKQLQDNTPEELPQQVLEQYMTFRREAVSAAEELAKGETTIEFETVENTTEEHGTEYAMLVYKVRSPHAESRLLIVASANYSVESRQQSWFVRSHQFHYTPHSFTPQVASGHGHSH